jgi:hypothetical protein
MNANPMNLCEVEINDSQEMGESKAVFVTEDGQSLLRNTYKDGERTVAIPAKNILEEIVKHTQGFPKTINSKLVVKSKQNELRYLGNKTEFFGWLFELFNVVWSRGTGIQKDEFFAFAVANADYFEASSVLPHFPPLQEVLYVHQTVSSGDGNKLNELVNRFQPATHEDHQLIKALVLTMFWGGGPGHRPAWLVTTSDKSANQGRGYGKTALVDLLGILCGGLIKFDQGISIEKLNNRLVNRAREEKSPRIIFVDNLKTYCLSNSDFESLVTAQQIDGHKLWKGGGSITNYFSLMMTMNSPCMSKDFAQRVISIELGKPTHNGSWFEDTKKFIEDNRWDIIADIKACLEGSSNSLPPEGCTRWGSWEKSVLSKIDAPEAVRELIKTRQCSLDGDAEKSESFRAYICEFIANSSITPAFTNPKLYRLPHGKMREILKDFFDEKISNNSVKQRIALLGLKCLRQTGKEGKSKFWIFHADGGDVTDHDLSPDNWIAQPKNGPDLDPGDDFGGSTIS